jgi:hypothetical protein
MAQLGNCGGVRRWLPGTIDQASTFIVSWIEMKSPWDTLNPGTHLNKRGIHRFSRDESLTRRSTDHPSQGGLD